MRTLITGINGFIGAHYGKRLQERGAWTMGLDLQPVEQTLHCDDYLQLDLGSPAAAQVLHTLPAFDYILHAGGISGFMVETDNPRRIFEVNVAGSMAVLDLARRTRCRRLVLCSTTMVYGPGAGTGAVLTETQYPEPISVYGASKLAVEALMHAFHGQYAVDAIALRFTHVYGPGRTTECFVRDMLAAAAAGRPCRIPQAGRSLRQYVHIDDVCRSIELAMDAANPRSRLFNISADEIHTLAEVAAVARAVTGALEVDFDDQRDLPNYRVGKLSIARAREELGYTPRLPLRQGIEAYWEASFSAAAAG